MLPGFGGFAQVAVEAGIAILVLPGLFNTLVSGGKDRDKSVMQLDPVAIVGLELIDTRLRTVCPDAQDIRKQFDGNFFIC